MTEQVESLNVPMDDQPEAQEAQVAPEAPKEAATAKQPVTQAPVQYDFKETGNKALDGALRILGRAGVAQDSFEMDAAREGNFAPLKAVLNHLKAQDGDIALSLLENAYNDYVTKEKAAKERAPQDKAEAAKPAHPASDEVKDAAE